MQRKLHSEYKNKQFSKDINLNQFIVSFSWYFRYIWLLKPNASVNFAFRSYLHNRSYYYVIDFEQCFFFFYLHNIFNYIAQDKITGMASALK